MARHGRGAQSLRARRRPVCGRPASRHRHRRRARCPCECTGGRSRGVRRLCGHERQGRDHRDGGRLLRDTRPSRQHRRAQGRGHQGRGSRGSYRVERNARARGAIRPPRDPRHRRSAGIRRSVDVAPSTHCAGAAASTATAAVSRARSAARARRRARAAPTRARGEPSFAGARGSTTGSSAWRRRLASFGRGVDRGGNRSDDDGRGACGRGVHGRDTGSFGRHGERMGPVLGRGTDDPRLAPTNRATSPRGSLRRRSVRKRACAGAGEDVRGASLELERSPSHAVSHVCARSGPAGRVRRPCFPCGTGTGRGDSSAGRSRSHALAVPPRTAGWPVRRGGSGDRAGPRENGKAAGGT